MYLVRLVYTSDIDGAFLPADIEKILEVSKRNNQKNNVTGLLCFNRRYFLQCLEGSRAKVNAAYHRILNDPRHTNIVMLDYTEIVMREFGNWSMGYMPESSLTAPINLKYSGSPEFEPYEMNGASAHQLMLELKEKLPNQ